MHPHIGKRLVISALAAIALFPAIAHAAWSDTIHVVTHNNTMVITDPSKGSNSYPAWGWFPSNDTEYRKVVLFITYKCPDGLHCGEWDYIDAVYLLRGNDSASTERIELARMISPYGWRFDSTWSFTWHLDITDFSLLLHDSAQIEFVHTGYESNSDRGWLITLDFAIIEGRPAMQPLGMDSLWCGSFPYGDTAKPIEALLKPLQFQNDSASVARLRIVQTGHGMDDSANCAEFCRKYRRVFFDDSLINERYIWRECGDNSLFPQAGTWIFDRANWCPGEIVFPDVYDIAISDGDTHSVNIDMEPYVNPNKPSANYHIYSYLFYFDQPWAENDVSIEEILVPSDLPEYSRMNPVCSGARFTVRNNGRAPVTSMTIRYGHDPSSTSTLEWQGDISPQSINEVVIPGELISSTSGRGLFVSLEKTNGSDDEYPLDNTAQVLTSTPLALPNRFVLLIRTNNQPEQNGYSITDQSGAHAVSRGQGSLAANTTYRDTLALQPGCYTFTMTDTADDGLDFWFNPEGGYGYIRFLTLDGRMLKSLNADFGREARFCFWASPDSASFLPNPVPVVQIFPPRNKGIFDIDLFYDTASVTMVRITNDSTKAVVFEKDFGVIKESVLAIDITSQPDGVYYAHVVSGEHTISRRIRIKRGE